MANLEKPVKFEAEVQWAFFTKKNEMSGKYQVDLTNLSENAVKALTDAGLEPRNREDKPEKGWFITAKSNYEIKPVDKAGNEITDAVGNGSKAVALIKQGDKASTAEQVRDRALNALATEARMMLDEGVVSSAAEIDLCMLMGSGWPMHLGGILPYLDREGISEAVCGQRFHAPGIASLP